MLSHARALSCLVILAAVFVASPSAGAEAQPPRLLDREYLLAVGLPTDMAFIASTAVNADKVLSDLYFELLGPHLPPLLRRAVGIVWQTWWMYLLTIYPHEFGHWSRAREIGGDFVIQGFALPWPKATMILPAGVDPLSEGLTSVGGFEINALMRRQTVDEFYARGYAHSDELIHALIQEIYYPGYAFLVAPAVGNVNPEDPQAWLHPIGDPMESSLLAFTAHAGRPAVRADGTVDPGLVSYYRECTLASVAAMLLDPMFYQSVLAFGADMAVDRGLVRPWLVGGDSFEWMYTTLFHPTPLGYELSLVNHFRVAGCPFDLALRFGRPFFDLGARIAVPGLILFGSLRLAVAIDYFYQEPYGHGVGIVVGAGWDIGAAWNVGLEAGGKTSGYLLGRPIAESASLRLEARYRR